MLFLSSVACLAACFAASRKLKKCENPLVFVGRKRHAAFSRKGRSDQILQLLGGKNQPKNKCKKSPHGTTEQVSKMIIFEVKIGPQMDPGGLRKRVRQTVGNRKGQKCLLEASGAGIIWNKSVLESQRSIY